MHTNTRTINIRPSRILVLGFFVFGLFISSLSVAYSATTAALLPTSDGNYTQWTPNAGATHYTQVDESACNGTTDYVSEITATERDSYGISLGSIINGSTITQIALIPCASRNSGGGGGSATMNVFYRYNGVNSADAGAYALTGTTPVALATTNFSSLSLVKTSTSTLEIGSVYTSGTKGARLSRLATVITYTPPAPTVTTNAASSTGISSATLNGLANPNGLSTTGWFRYSTTNPGTCSDSFGTRAPVSGGDALGSGSSVVAYNEPITGLTPNTTHYYCAIASSTSGTSFGTVQSLTTLPQPVPTVVTNAASSVTFSTAVLNGTGNPNGASATGWFRYSTTNPGTCDDVFGTRAPVSGGDALGSGSSAVAFSESVTGLSEATTYYYCAIGSNVGGTGVGSVQNFTTPANTLPVAPSGATASNVSGTENAISWTDNSFNEAGFKVERSTNGGLYTQIATTSANAISYNDTSAIADNTYTYRVRAYNIVGNSSYNTTDYVITATVVPNDPTSLDYYIGTTSVDVVMFWSHTGNNEDGFKIERSTDNVNFSIVGTSNRSTLYHFETAPGSGTYYYRVYAHNAVGNSGNSNTITVVVP